MHLATADSCGGPEISIDCSSSSIRWANAGTLSAYVVAEHSLVKSYTVASTLTYMHDVGNAHG